MAFGSLMSQFNDGCPFFAGAEVPSFLLGTNAPGMDIPPIILPSMVNMDVLNEKAGVYKLPVIQLPDALLSPMNTSSFTSSPICTESSEADLATDDDGGDFDDNAEDAEYVGECERCGRQCGCINDENGYTQPLQTKFDCGTSSLDVGEIDKAICERCGGYCGCSNVNSDDDESMPNDSSMHSLINHIPFHVLMDYDRIDEPPSKVHNQTSKQSTCNDDEHVVQQTMAQIEQSKEGSCTHPKVDFSTCACLLCGLVLSADYVSSIAQVNDFEESRYVRGKTVRKTPLYPDGLDLPFDKEVINRASAISDGLNMKGNRINKLKMRRFACLYLALRELNRTYNLHDVADAVGLKRTDMSPAITLFSSIHSGYRPPKEAIMNLSEHSSITMAIGRAETLKADPESKELIRYLIIKAIKFHGSTITRRRSETIASGALSVYREITGIDLPPENLYITKISETTLKQVHDEIMEAYNMG